MKRAGVNGNLPLQLHSLAFDAHAVAAEHFERDSTTAAAAAHATIVNCLAAVGYAVAAGAGGVVASAHTARVKNFSAFRDSIAACARLAVAPANSARVQLLAAVGHTIASSTGPAVSSTHATIIENLV